jgi:hypothetical protein
VYRYFKQVALDLDATRTAFIATTRRKLDEVGALLAEAEREAQRADARLARIEGDYTDGKLEVEDWRRLRDRLAPEQEGAMAQVQRLSSHASALEAAGAEVDVETGLLRKLADIRQAIAGDVRKAKGVESVRAALIPTFETFVLHRSSPRRVHVELIGSDMWIAPILRPGAIKRHTPSGWDLPRPAALSLVADDSPTNYVWAIAVATLTR